MIKGVYVGDTREARIVESMERYGGGFITALARLWRVADAPNKARIEAAFKPEFDQYALFVLQDKKEYEQQWREREDVNASPDNSE